jgi:hypothetical protein
MTFHTTHGSGMCNCIPMTGGYVRHNPGCPMEPVESHVLRQAHAIDTAQLRQRFAALLTHHLDGDHMWDEYAFEGDGVEYMETAHKAIHDEDGHP